VGADAIRAAVGTGRDGHAGGGAVYHDIAGHILGVEGQSLRGGISQAAEKGTGNGGWSDGGGAAEGIGQVAKSDVVGAGVAGEGDGGGDGRVVSRGEIQGIRAIVAADVHGIRGRVEVD